jgi:hypothetical protein
MSLLDSLLNAFNKYQALGVKEKEIFCDSMESRFNEIFQDKPIAQAFCQRFIERVKVELKEEL